MPKMVSLLFDVEDPFSLATDDAALIVANTVAEAGIRGTFCISGLKCRKLMERDRHDVIDALKQHCLGLHTDGHSLHPTTMEMLEVKGWEDGVAAAMESEGRALDSFQRAFGRTPVCWGGGGNTWGPQITEACRQLGIRSVVYSQFGVPGRHVHEFIGVPSFSTTGYFGEDNMEDDAKANAAFEAAAQAIRECPSPWSEIFGGHPTRYRHTDYWDGPFYHGATPDVYVSPPLRDEAKFQNCMRNLARGIHRLREEFEVLGLDDVLNKTWHYRELSAEELESITERTVGNIRASSGWPPNKENLDTDRIVEETLQRIHTLRIAETCE